MEISVKTEYVLAPPVINPVPEKRSHNGVYRWFVARGVALGATKVEKEESSDRRKREKLWEKTSLNDGDRDMVTGLPNFKGFEKQVSSLIQHKKVTGTGNFGIILISICEAPEIIENPEGNQKGLILNEMVFRVTECLRESDYLARTHWNEFSLIVQNIEHDSEVLVVQNRIEKQLNYPFWIKGERLELDFKVDSVMQDRK